MLWLLQSPYRKPPLMTFTPTAEQDAILAAFTDGKDLVIQAGAGTGKTTTLKLLANSTPRYGTYLAFNKAIQMSAAQSMPSTVRCKTAHGLAWQEFGNQYAARMNTNRPAWATVIDFLNAVPLTVPAFDGKRRSLTAYQTARLVLDTVKGYCQTAAPDITAAHIPAIPGVSGPGGLGATTGGMKAVDFVLPRARKAWADIQKTHDGILVFDHSYYLKMWALTNPTIGGDYLMFDEAQDANGVIAGVVNAQTHLQRVFVGDDSQSIMGFAGAHNAMRKFARREGVITLSLTESFRFGPRIATAANGLLDHLNAPLRITGTPAMDSTVTTLDYPGAPTSDAILCRTNAGALDEVINAQNDGKKVCLLGNADELRKFVEAARDLQEKGSTNYHALMAFESWADVQDYVEVDPSAADLVTMVDLVDTYGAAPLLAALQKCVQEHRADVTVSTAHKAKGCEWDNVRISKDFALSDEIPPEAFKAELMLAYVAVTRARLRLDSGLLAPWLGQPTATNSPVIAPAPAAPAPTLPAAPAAMQWDVPSAADAFAIPVPAVVAAAEARIDDAAELPDLMDGEDLPDHLAETPASAPVPAPVPSAASEPLTLALDPDSYGNLADAADRFGLSPDEFAMRLLTGALANLTR
jgi:hypothetical protein